MSATWQTALHRLQALRDVDKETRVSEYTGKLHQAAQKLADIKNESALWGVFKKPKHERHYRAWGELWLLAAQKPETAASYANTVLEGTPAGAALREVMRSEIWRATNGLRDLFNGTLPEGLRVEYANAYEKLDPDGFTHFRRIHSKSNPA